MRHFITFSLVLLSLTAVGQVPFTTYKGGTLPGPQTISEVKNLKTNTPEDRTTLRANIEQLRQANQKKTDSLSLEYFDHLSANAVFIQNAQKMFPTIHGEVVNYKLGIWTSRIYSKEPADDCKGCKDEKDRFKKRICREEWRLCRDKLVDSFRVHYLPFSIITKLSGNYVDSSAGPTNDATSIFGAPLTFRFSPAMDLLPNLKNNKLFIGLNADLRLLTLADTVANKLTASWGAYVSVGLSYLGKGYAYDTDEAERHDGRFSFSAMLYWFKSGGEFNRAVFGDYEKKELTGVEILLRFKTTKKEDSKFNFLFGANNGFKRGAPNFAKWQFQLGIGT